MIDVINEAINRKLNSMSFTNVINGVVESIDPLSIRINDRISIGLGFIEPKSLDINDDSPNPALPFIVGDKINMIRYNNGQRFYVLGAANNNAAPSGGVIITSATTSTAAEIAAKIATSTNGGYVPKSGDIIALTLTTANTAANATLNIDGSGAKNIRIGGDNATAAALNNAANGIVYLIYDGTYYNLIGMVRNVDNDTTYSEITEAEITTGTDSTARAISGRRMKFALDSRLNGYQIQKNGTDGIGIINFKTE